MPAPKGSQNHLTHGASRAGQWFPEYRAWAGMIQRCYNPNVERFKNYGGRGITVCKRWLTPFYGGSGSYENFIADMGEKPEPKHLYSIDRIDNDGPYSPANCRWTTMSKQALNRPRKYIGPILSNKNFFSDYAYHLRHPRKSL